MMALWRESARPFCYAGRAGDSQPIEQEANVFAVTHAARRNDFHREKVLAVWLRHAGMGDRKRGAFTWCAETQLLADC